MHHSAAVAEEGRQVELLDLVRRLAIDEESVEVVLGRSGGGGIMKTLDDAAGERPLGLVRRPGRA